MAKNIWYFFLDEKVSKTSRKNDASTPEGKTPGPPFFHPTARVLWFILYLFFLIKTWQGANIIITSNMKVKHIFFLRHACTDL